MWSSIWPPIVFLLFSMRFLHIPLMNACIHPYTYIYKFGIYIYVFLCIAVFEVFYVLRFLKFLRFLGFLRFLRFLRFLSF